MKLYASVLVFFFYMSALASSKIGTINDPDGYVNVRALENDKSAIVDVVHENGYFNYFENLNADWWLVHYKNIYGYIHKSRIKHIKDGFFYTDNNVMVTAKNVNATAHNYAFNNITVKVIQLSAKNETFYCKALLQTIQKNHVIAEKKYTDIEPIGGNYGIRPFDEQPSSNFFFLLKSGDYDGNLLIVDKQGKIQNHPGGAYFFTQNNKYLITVHESDLAGLTIFDINKNKAHSFEPEYYLRNWYISNNTYYFEADYGLDGTKDIRMLELDLATFSIKDSKLSPKQGTQLTLTTKECYCN